MSKRLSSYILRYATIKSVKKCFSLAIFDKNV